MNYQVIPIKKEETYEWLLNKHYAKRIPSISFAFGLYSFDVLEGICTFGLPASPDLCSFICGEEFKNDVIELNRLCVNDGLQKNSTSFFVGKVLNLLEKPRIVVSFADNGQNHQGYIYQATNWIFTGKTKKQFDLKIKGTNKHSRHVYDYKHLETERVERTIKNRYVFFCGDRRQKAKYLKAFKLSRFPYPKGQNKRYDASYKPSTQIIAF